MHAHIDSGENLVRRATKDDMLYILAFAKKFFGHTRLKDNVALDDESFLASMAGFIDGEPFKGGVFILGEEPQGVIAGLVYDTWFNTSVKTGQDLFWWIEPEHRNFASANAMLRALEDWARSEGAMWFTMAVTETMRPQSLEKWYRRRGYEPSERHFIRRL